MGIDTAAKGSDLHSGLKTAVRNQIDGSQLAYFTGAATPPGTERWQWQ